MAIEVRPPLPDAERSALERALAEAGLVTDSFPEAYESAWRRAAAEEAVETDLELPSASVELS